MRKRTIRIVSSLASKNGGFTFVLAATILLTAVPAFTQDNRPVGVNVVLKGAVTDTALDGLAPYGTVLSILYEINAVTMKARESQIPAIEALPFVAAVAPDAERYGGPVDTVNADDFADGLSTWNLDAINVTDFGFNNRKVGYDGTGVYVAVLDTGLVDSWRQYFPEQRIATEYAICFGGGGGERGFVSTQPNKWEHDQDSHGTHVTSTILGYNFFVWPINGVAPMAKVIPVKVLNQSGWGWSSVVAEGILYVARLKAGPLAGSPVIINMSLGGPQMDPMEQVAIDYAIGKGVIVVASAGNRGAAGMGYPGAYGPVISVAASGWVGEWPPGNPYWWYILDVAEPTDPEDFYIADFSSRALPGQDLDVAAPGSWVVGPYQLQSGHIDYFYLGGTSMASPHVAGIVALMAEKNPALTAADADGILEANAIYLAPGTRTILTPWGTEEHPSWGADATGAGLATADLALTGTP